MDVRLYAALLLADAVAPGWVPNPGSLAQDIYASDNIPALIRFGRDPLTLREVNVRDLRGLVELMGRAHDAMAHLHGPVLLLGWTARPARSARGHSQRMGRPARHRAPRLLSQRLSSAVARP